MMFRRVMIAAATIVLVSAALPAAALDTHVSPLVVNIRAGSTSQTITVQNTSLSSSLRLQVAAFKWTQEPGAPEKVLPTDDIAFFPSLLTVEPGGTRAVRVGIVNSGKSPVERTYRVIFRELPSLESAFAPNSATISVRMQLSIPIYVEPLKPAPKPTLESAVLHDGKLSFRLSNAGNAHFKVLSLSVTGLDSHGASVSNDTIHAPVMLANASQSFDVPIERAACAKVREVTISVLTDGGNAKRTFPTAQDQCR